MIVRLCGANHDVELRSGTEGYDPGQRTSGTQDTFWPKDQDVIRCLTMRRFCCANNARSPISFLVENAVSGTGL